MGNSKIRYAEKIDLTSVLGPYKRAVLWVYGCCFDCPGCIAQNFRFGKYLENDTHYLAEWFLNTGRKHLTISGGEPMLQAGPLSEMIDIIREKEDIGIIVYSGFEYEELQRKALNDPGIDRFLSEIDILIDGRYEKDLDHNEPYRGSSNQRIITLSAHYPKKIIDDYYYNTEGRKIDLVINEEKTMMIGVPSSDQKTIWNKIIKISDD